MFSTKIVAGFALVTVLFFVALIGLQVAEILTFSAEPSVWIAAR